ncbi:MAG: HDIG domain-containing protein [Deltaproteobacteria bacterium]|nr:MAG: HDIG domain-containing protein [Deltaproteobacteria bacterium]
MSRFRTWMESATHRDHAARPSLVRWITESRVGRILLFTLFIVAVVSVLQAGGERPVEHLDQDDIGTVLRRPLIASHDFRWERVDNTQLEQARSAAMDSVLPVWDFEAERIDLVTERVSRAFQAMRARLGQEALRREHEQMLADAADDEDTTPPPTVDDETMERRLQSVLRAPEAWSEVLRHLPADDRVELVASESAFEEFIRQLQRSVPPEALAALAQEGFSHDAEMALRRILGTTLDRRIVDDRRVLEAESGAGIQLRILTRDGLQRESRVRDFDAFLSVQDVLPYLERQAALEGGLASTNLREALLAIAQALVQPNTRHNETETAARRNAAAEAVSASTQVQQFRRGQIILDAGRVVTEETVAIAFAMEASAEDEPPSLWPLLGLALVVLLITLPLVRFSLQHLAFFSQRSRDLLMMGTLLVLHLAATRAAIFVVELIVEAGVTLPAEALFVLVPFATGAMVVRLLTSAENALVYSILYGLLIGVLFQFDLTWVLFSLVASIVGTSSVGATQSRTEVMKAGLIVGVTMAGVALGIGFLLASLAGTEIFVVALMALLSGVLSALLVFMLMPLFEELFDYTTSFKLLELANLNHPALRELILHAPGSYHHSMMVGQLVEAACEAVGANPLLGRVGSYFHDIGKAKNPKYFAENQEKGNNPHDRLKPHMSSLIIKAHVKDGVELARQHRLPPEIIDFIREHHGTSLIEFFYNRAREESEGDVDEHEFRYPGPRPQSRETAICLLADGIEAASRTLPEKSRDRITQLVNRMINRAFSDGQLEECDLTLRDLNLIAQAFIARLSAFHHHRPEYPDARKSQQLRAQRRPTPSPSSGPDSDAHEDRDGESDNEPAQERPADQASEGSDHDRTAGGDDTTGADPDGSGTSDTESDVPLRRLGV